MEDDYFVNLLSAEFEFKGQKSGSAYHLLCDGIGSLPQKGQKSGSAYRL